MHLYTKFICYNFHILILNKNNCLVSKVILNLKINDAFLTVKLHFKINCISIAKIGKKTTVGLNQSCFCALFFYFEVSKTSL